MDVRLASGQIVTNIPEGIDPQELLAKLSASGVDVSEDYKSLPKPKTQVVSGPESFRNAAREEAATRSAPARFLQGAGETMDRWALGAKGLVTDLTDEDKQRLAHNRIMADEGGMAASAGQIAGDVAISAPLMIGGAAAAPVAARMLPQAVSRAAASLPGRVAGVVAPNAALGALSAPEDRATGAAYGAAGGVAGAGLNRAIGGAVRPFVSREATELMEQGIQPTPGQAIGGAVGKIEEKLGSVPIVGDIIGGARNRAIGEFNEALAGRASQQVTGARGLPRAAGRALGETGDEALLALRRQIGNVYENTLAQVPRLRIERDVVEREVARIASDPALALSDETAQRLFSYVEKNLLARGADITGDVAKRMESDLGKAATRFKYSPVGEEKAYGEALDRVHTVWRDSIMGSLPPQAQRALQNANAAWRGFQPLDVAASTAGSQLRGGVSTPRVLRSALAKGDKSQSDNVLRDLQRRPVAAAANPYEYAASMSRAGQTLGDVVPDSGTAGRLFAGMGVPGGALALGASPLATLAAGTAAVGGTALAYSRMGAQLLTQGAFPATREAVSAWLETQGLPREVIPALAEQVLAGYSRTQRPLGRSLQMQR